MIYLYKFDQSNFLNQRCTTWVIPTTPKPTSPPFTCPSETTNGFFADPSCSCCNTYYICNQGTSYPMVCFIFKIH